MEGLGEKTSRYIAATEKILREMKITLPQRQPLRKRAEESLELARQYVKDAKYYQSKEDYGTSLTCIAYAEGLLDSLKNLGWLHYEWRARTLPKKPLRVVIAGTWDLIHPGHIWLMKKAKERGYLTVIVARDSTSKRIKGRRPVVPEDQRLEVVKALKPVDEATLGEENHDILKIVERLKPDLILLGPDQHYDPVGMKAELKKRGLKTKVERVKEVYTDSKLNSSTLIILQAAKVRKEMAK
jgi:FAD synthetase